MAFTDRAHGRFRDRRIWTKQAVLLCLICLSHVSLAQIASDSVSVTASSSPPSTVTSWSELSSTPQPRGSRSITFSTSTLPSNFTSTRTSQPTDDSGSDIFSPSTDDDDDDDDDSHSVTGDTVFNYYFLFLILFGVLVAVLFWWLRRQRQRRKEQTRRSGQSALARDLEGWPTARRFMHGRYGRPFAPSHVRREEGLDEHGEAPPPYHPKSETLVGTRPAGPQQESYGNITVPLRTLPRGDVEQLRPPAYSNAQGNAQTTSTLPDR